MYTGTASPGEGEIRLRGSCDSCLESKVKCSQTKPACDRCRQRDDSCVYSPCRKIGRPSHDSTSASSSLSSSASTKVRKSRAIDTRKTERTPPSPQSSKSRSSASQTKPKQLSPSSAVEQTWQSARNTPLRNMENGKGRNSSSASRSSSCSVIIDSSNAHAMIDPPWNDGSIFGLATPSRLDFCEESQPYGDPTIIPISSTEMDLDLDAELLNDGFGADTLMDVGQGTPFISRSIFPCVDFNMQPHATDNSHNSSSSSSIQSMQTSLIQRDSTSSCPIRSGEEFHLQSIHSAGSLQRRSTPPTEASDPNPFNFRLDAIFNMGLIASNTSSPQTMDESLSRSESMCMLPTLSSRSSSTTSSASEPWSPCEQQCHLNLTVKLHRLSEYHRKESPPSPTALLHLGDMIHLDRDRVMRCRPCMHQSQRGRTLMLLAMEIDAMLNLVEAGDALETGRRKAVQVVLVQQLKFAVRLEEALRGAEEGESSRSFATEVITSVVTRVENLLESL